MKCCPALWTYKFKRRILHLVITDSVPRATARGSHNSGESPVLTRQNDRAEERPDSRADLLVHSLQPRTKTHTQTDKQAQHCVCVSVCVCRHTHTDAAGPLYENNWANQFILGRDFFQTVWVVTQSTAWRENNEKFLTCLNWCLATTGN